MIALPVVDRRRSSKGTSCLTACLAWMGLCAFLLLAIDTIEFKLESKDGMGNWAHIFTVP